MLTDKCKPGDLALVIGGKSNVGRLVLVEYALTPINSELVIRAAPTYRGNGTIWAVTSKGPPFDIISYRTGEKSKSMQATCPDAWLMPLRPDPTLITEEKEKEHAHKG